MDKGTNPALRLQAILSEIQSRIRQGQTVAQVLGGALDVPAENTEAILSKLLFVAHLYDDVSETLSQINGIEHLSYIEKLPGSRRRLFQAVLGADSQSDGKLAAASDQSVILSLKFCGLRVAESFSEPAVEGDEIKQLMKSVDELFLVTEELKFDDELKRFSLDLLGILRGALADYKIRGVSGLADSIERALGKLQFYYVRSEKAKEGQHLEQIKRIFDVIIKFDTVVARAKQYVPMIAEATLRLLGSA